MEAYVGGVSLACWKDLVGSLARRAVLDQSKFGDCDFLGAACICPTGEGPSQVVRHYSSHLPRLNSVFCRRGPEHDRFSAALHGDSSVIVGSVQSPVQETVYRDYAVIVTTGRSATGERFHGDPKECTACPIFHL
jgi:hypothetical protein